jgi:hypothetical protein
VRRVRRRLALVQADGERVAHFLAQETAVYWHAARVREGELAEARGRLAIADSQLDAIMARWGITRPLSTARGRDAG